MLALNSGVSDLRPILDEILSSSAWNILEQAFNQGGYIAGGFARKLYRCLDGIDNIRSVNEYLYVRGGDVDVFFPSKDSCDRASFNIHGWGLIANNDFAYTFTKLNGRGNLNKIQYVKHFTAPPEEMLASFDIVNAMVALTRTGIYIDDRVIELESKKTLDLDSVDGMRTIMRVMRWTWRHELPTLTPSAVNMINSFVKQIMDQHRTKLDLDFVIGRQLNGDEITVKCMYSALSGRRVHVSSENLINLWFYVGNVIGHDYFPVGNEYVSWAEAALNKRAGFVNRSIPGKAQ